MFVDYCGDWGRGVVETREVRTADVFGRCLLVKRQRQRGQWVVAGMESGRSMRPSISNRRPCVSLPASLLLVPSPNKKKGWIGSPPWPRPPLLLPASTGVNTAQTQKKRKGPAGARHRQSKKAPPSLFPPESAAGCRPPPAAVLSHRHPRPATGTTYLSLGCVGCR